MMRKVPTASRRMKAYFYDDKVSAEVVMNFYADDPMVVAMHMTPAHGDSAMWAVSREVLNAATWGGQREAGLGDFVVERAAFTDLWPGEQVLLFHMTSEEGHQHLVVPRMEVASFVQQTKFQVPVGHEDYSADIDDLIRRILTQ